MFFFMSCLYRVIIFNVIRFKIITLTVCTVYTYTYIEPSKSLSILGAKVSKVKSGGFPVEKLSMTSPIHKQSLVHSSNGISDIETKNKKITNKETCIINSN